LASTVNKKKKPLPKNFGSIKPKPPVEKNLLRKSNELVQNKLEESKSNDNPAIEAKQSNIAPTTIFADQSVVSKREFNNKQDSKGKTGKINKQKEILAVQKLSTQEITPTTNTTGSPPYWNISTPQTTKKTLRQILEEEKQTKERTLVKKSVKSLREIQEEELLFKDLEGSYGTEVAKWLLDTK